MKKKRWLRRSLRILFALFLLANIVAAFHAWKFTHFATGTAAKPRDEKQLSFPEKLSALILGVDLPRPHNERIPTQAFETIQLQSNCRLECWKINAAPAKGTVILFHGYGACKSNLLDKAGIFLQLGYSTLLVDFMGSGGSEGNQTTIGSKEAENVKTCYEYLQQQGEKHIYLFGTSMGAAAILKSIHDYHINPGGIIIECPYGTMYQTVCARFDNMHVPSFPMAALLVLWGGLENGFNAFTLNPAGYAYAVHCPALFLYGGKDEKVSRAETDSIYAHLQGDKQLKIYSNAGHENYLQQYRQQWTDDVDSFLQKIYTGQSY